MNWCKVWIVGNGPSRQTFDFEALRKRGDTVVVINKGLNEFPWADVFFSLDHNFITANFKALQIFEGEVHLVVRDKSYIPFWKEMLPVHSGNFYLRSYANGFSDDPQVLCTGCNSGYAAVNLCYLKGSKEIHLLGYDMNPNDPHEKDYRFWAREFDYTLPQLAEKEVKVFNHNPDSNIQAYPKVEVNAFNHASC